MGPVDGWKERISDSERRLEELRRTLADASKEYNLAKAEYENAQAVHMDVGGFGNPDGAVSYRRAHQAYLLRFERYREALHQYSEFILGKSD